MVIRYIHGSSQLRSTYTRTDLYQLSLVHLVGLDLGRLTSTLVGVDLSYTRPKLPWSGAMSTQLHLGLDWPWAIVDWTWLGPMPNRLNLKLVMTWLNTPSRPTHVKLRLRLTHLKLRLGSTHLKLQPKSLTQLLT